MRAQIPRVVALLLILLALGWSRSRLIDKQGADGALHHRDAPNSFFSVFAFGGFKPMFLEYLWTKADALAREERWWEVIDVYQRIARLDPQNPRAWFAQGYSMTYNLGQFEPDDRERWRLYRRALNHLERGLKENPNDWNLMELRFNVYFRHIAPDPYLNEHARLNLGNDGMEGALRSALAMREAFPERLSAWDIERIAVEESTEWLMNRGRLSDAAELLDLLQVSGNKAREQFPREADIPRALRAWAAWASLLRRTDSMANWAAIRGGQAPSEASEAAMLAVLEDLGSLAQRPMTLVWESDVEYFDAAAYSLIQFKGMELAQLFALAKMPDSALRLSAGVAKLARLPGGEIGPRMPYYTEVYVASFRALLDADQAFRSRPSDPPRPPKESFARLQKAGEELDRLVKERAGKSDGFVRRFLNSRRGP
ncbi:MAG: hypothetical protein V3W41_05360 [Planctomycetota bacterium]